MAKLNRYSLRIVREVSRLETLDVIVAAKNEKAATEIAKRFGDGEQPAWPDIDNYVVVDIEDLDTETVEISDPRLKKHSS